MDNEQFQNELNNILNEMLWNNINQNRIPRNNSYYRRNTHSNESDNVNILNNLRVIMQGYNENMREYNTNVRSYLQIMELMIRESSRVQQPITEPRRAEVPRTRSRVRTQTQTQMPQFLSYMIYPLRDGSGNIGTNRQRQNFQDVIVRPTTEQFDQATRTIIYNNDVVLPNARCPISLEDFVEGDTIRQIIHCGHAFSEEPIQNWFQSNVRCPVCRHDIRENNEAQSQDVSGNAQTQNDIDNIINGLTANISSILNRYSYPEFYMENNDLVYNFQIPVYYNDLSGNSNQGDIINQV